MTLGADIVIIGHPFTGNPWTYVEGDVSNTVNRELQLDAKLAVGNSGSPILDKTNNRVVGMLFQIGDKQTANLNTLGSEQTGDTTGEFGFAHPIDRILEQIRNWGAL